MTEHEFIERVARFNIEVINLKLEVRRILNQNQLMDFIEYWTEKNPNGRKMRFEKEKTFDISKRLKRWKRNDEKWNPVKRKIDISRL